MLHPTEAIAIAPKSSAHLISSAPASSSTLAGLSAQRPPSLRESPDPSARTLEPTVHDSYGLLLAIPERPITRLPRKGGYPKARGGLSLLPRIFRRHQHPHSGVSRGHRNVPHASDSHYSTSPDFRSPQASLPDCTPRIRVHPTRPSDDLSLCQLDHIISQTPKYTYI